MASLPRTRFFYCDAGPVSSERGVFWIDVKSARGSFDPDGYRLSIGEHRVIFEIGQSGIPVIVTIMQVEKRNERTY